MIRFIFQAVSSQNNLESLETPTKPEKEHHHSIKGVSIRVDEMALKLERGTKMMESLLTHLKSGSSGRNLAI